MLLLKSGIIMLHLYIAHISEYLGTSKSHFIKIEKMRNLMMGVDGHGLYEDG